MDPEDLREIISAYQKCVAETVQRFGGFVAKYMGDGVLVYFGYPQAHEDDAERAVRAGLELIVACSRCSEDLRAPSVSCRHYRLVVVGDLIGSGASQEQAIVGETPNLAARLQGIAEPNGVVIASAICSSFKTWGTQELKGYLRPRESLGGATTSFSRKPLRGFSRDRPDRTVGREEELELILRRWAKAKSGQGQVVLLSGEPGIGKSRLTAAVMERLAGEQHVRLRYYSSPQATDSAFVPIIGHLQRAAGFLHNDSPQAKLDKLDALLARTGTAKQDAAIFAELLSPNDGRYPALQLPPQQRRQKTFAALDAQLEALAREQQS